MARRPEGRTEQREGRRVRAEEAPPRHSAPEDYREPPAIADGNGSGIAAMVVGMLALTLAFLVFPAIAAVLLGIAAIILGVVGMRNAKRMSGLHKGLSVTGLVTGILALALGLAVIIGGVTLADQVQLEELQQQLEGATGS